MKKASTARAAAAVGGERNTRGAAVGGEGKGEEEEEEERRKGDAWEKEIRDDVARGEGGTTRNHGTEQQPPWSTLLNTSTCP